MALLKITAHVVLESERNPEDVASDFNRGFESAVTPFFRRDRDDVLVAAEVEKIEAVSPEEAHEQGWVE